MIDLPENELFSAYLDGELTAEEQSQVEQLLTTSAAARQLVDELRALSSTLQSLPIQKPGVDLSPRVLRAAERQILSGGNARPQSGGDTRPVEAGPRSEPVPSPGAIVGRDLWKRLVRPRSLLWAAAIFLVALLVRWQEWRQSNPPAARPQDGQQIAMAPAPSEVKETPSIHAPENRTASRDPHAAEPTDSGAHALFAESPTSAVDSLARKGSPASTYGSQPPALPELGAGGGKRDATVGMSPLDSLAGGQSRNGAGVERSARSPMSAGGPSSGQQANAPADAFALRDKAGERLPEKQALQTAPPMPIARSAAAPRPARASAHARQSKAVQNVLMVECEVTFQAARDHVFERMLDDQQSAVEGQRRKLGEAAKKDADEDVKLEAISPSDPASAPSGPGGLVSSGPAGQVEQRASAAETRSFELEATPQQLGVILQWLKARPVDFPSVTPSPEVNRLRNRSDLAASFGATRQQADAVPLASPSPPAKVSPPVTVEKAAAADRPVAESRRDAEALAESRKGLASQRGNAVESEQTPRQQQAQRPMAATLMLKPSAASASTSGQSSGWAQGGQSAGPPGGPTYRVRFILRIVSPEPSTADDAVADRASSSAKPAESKPASAAAGRAPVAEPAAEPPPAAGPSK